jgi:hypothetical protein
VEAIKVCHLFFKDSYRIFRRGWIC